MLRVLVLILLLPFCPAAWAETFVSSDVPMPIPDGGVAHSYLTIPINRVILDLNITFTVTHTWDGDLGLYLEAPNGTDIRLVYRCGGSQNSGDNFTNTTLDDEAGTYVCNTNPPYTGTFQPEHPLYALDGLGTLGQWEFRATDFASGDVGSIQAWRLDIVLGDTLDARDPPLGLPPSTFTLSCYPNPFNSATTLAFALANAGAVNLTVFDITGRQVGVLTDRRYSTGEHRVTFDGADLSSGIYIAHLIAEDRILTQRLLLVK